LGPIFVKFGQILSTRRDLLPDDLAEELAKLQDQVPPFPGTQARAIIEKSWGKPIEAVLDGFDEQPLASASIAQVHIARLKDGREVVVKVVRPGIERIIRRDLGLLLTLAELAHRYWKDGRRLRPVEVVKDYQKTILDELDLQREAANASQLRKNFLGSSLLYVPEVHWDLCNPSVMVMERIHGTPVGEVDRLKAQGVSMKLLGERGVEIFFTQVFQHNFFHADMHPGNIFVEPSGRYIAVDFGIVGTLTSEDQRYLAENLLAFFHHDYRRVAELHILSGWVPAHTRVDEFESAIRTVCEPIFGKPLAQISFGYFLLHLFQTARRFDMEVQPQLVLLQKTLLNIEGLGPSALPRAGPLDHRQALHGKVDEGPDRSRALWARLKRNLGPYSEGVPELPLLAYRVLQGLDRQSLSIRWRSDELDRLRNEIRAHHARVQALLAGTGLIVSGTLLLVFGPGPLISIPAAQALAIGLILVGGLVLAGRWR
jgi:ubiquinone biosynthesis protein